MKKTSPLLRLLKPAIFTSTLILSSLAFAQKPDFPDVTLPEKANGQRAIQLLADRLPAVATWYGMTPAEFAKMIRTDHTAWLDTKGRLFYIEEQVSGSEAAPQPAEASFAYADTFKLHSKPGANRVIYLDFTGHTISGHGWASGETVVSPPFTLDADTASFSTAEMDAVQEVWKRVAEDYAPFDVDVTTEDPGQDAIDRSSLSDQNYGTRALITTWDSRLCGSCGGVAYVGVFDITGSLHEYYQPAYVFYDKLAKSARYIAEAASHEVGHNLGLNHDGTSSVGYYQGQGSGATGWAPIMGVGYYQQLTQWSKGEYADANNLEDDVVVMQQNGAPLITDDHLGGLDASATGLTISAGSAAGTSAVSGSGVISEPSDRDVFKFASGAGDISINVAPAATGGNLDIEASLYNSAGTLLATSNPVDATNASISLVSQPAGIYYLDIDGVGKGDPYVDGYTDYGSLGKYVINGTIPEVTTGLQAPVAVISQDATSGTAPMTVSFNASGSTDADGNIVSYSWNFGDGSSASGASASHVFNTSGNYTVSLTVTDNDGLTGTASVGITVAANPNVPPAAPSNLVGTKTVTGGGKNKTTSISLSWTDNSSNENNFVIERCQEIGSRKSVSCVYNSSLNITVGANVTSYNVGTVSGTYHYRVKAVNANGASATSNEVKL